jgi:hypothetical protein
VFGWSITVGSVVDLKWKEHWMGGCCVNFAGSFGYGVHNSFIGSLDDSMCRVDLVLRKCRQVETIDDECGG